MIGCINFLLCGVMASIHPAVAVPGASCHRGCLVQYNGFDPDRPTIVITHGFNPLVRRIRLNHAACFSSAIRMRCGDRFNLMGWDWNQAAFDHLSGRRNTNMAIRQGHLLACQLRRLGVRPESTWLIGHSLGAIVMSKAASDWSSGSGCRIAQLTLLDPICVQHRMIFGWFRATSSARHVEHYWAGGRSGVGRHTLRRGVYTKRVRGRAPLASWVAPRGNHSFLIEWYYHSICSHGGSGFSRGLRCFWQNACGSDSG